MANAENPLLSLSSEKQQQIVDLVDNGNIDKIAEKGGMTRRQVLQVAVALGAGATAGGYSVDQIIGEARAAADTSDSDGNVGLPGDRVDLFAEGADISGTATAAQVGTSSDRFTGFADTLDANTVSTDSLSLTPILDETIPFASGGSRTRFIASDVPSGPVIPTATPAGDPDNDHGYRVEKVFWNDDGSGGVGDYSVVVTETENAGGGDARITVWALDV